MPSFLKPPAKISKYCLSFNGVVVMPATYQVKKIEQPLPDVSVEKFVAVAVSTVVLGLVVVHAAGNAVVVYVWKNTEEVFRTQQIGNWTLGISTTGGMGPIWYPVSYSQRDTQKA